MPSVSLPKVGMMKLLSNLKMFVSERDIFSTGAMGALAPAIFKNRLLATAIFGHFSTGGKKCGC